MHTGEIFKKIDFVLSKFLELFMYSKNPNYKLRLNLQGAIT